MRQRTLLDTIGCAIVAAATFVAFPAKAQPSKPNIVFVLFDNVG